MTRARAKAIHDKVTSLLTLQEFDVRVNGSLPHMHTLCILSYIPSTEPQDGAKDDREGGREDEEEETTKTTKKEKGQEARPAARPRPAFLRPQARALGHVPGLGRPSCISQAGALGHHPGLGRPSCTHPSQQIQPGLGRPQPDLAGFPAWKKGIFPCNPPTYPLYYI